MDTDINIRIIGIPGHRVARVWEAADEPQPAEQEAAACVSPYGGWRAQGDDMHARFTVHTRHGVCPMAV